MIPPRSCHASVVFLALGWGCILLAGGGCSMDEGYTGATSGVEYFAYVRGCVNETAEPGPDDDTLGLFSLPVPIPFDISSFEVILEVFNQEVDLVFGAGEPPVGYFSFGPTPGKQMILVSPDSYFPSMARVWYAGLYAPLGVAGECDPGVAPDWRLSARSAIGTAGFPLLDVECDSPDCLVPACTVPASCAAQSFSIEIPRGATSLQVILESRQNDADLFLTAGLQTELYSSMNPGTGYDIIRLGPEVCIPLRGETVIVNLESWEQATQDYRLRVTYLP